MQLEEQKIKAGLVYNILKYTEWPEKSPPGDKPHLNICLFGGNPSDSYLSSLEGQTVQQYVLTLARKDRIRDTTDCNMVFVDPGQRDALPELLMFLNNKHVLTMSDMERFARSGGMVELAIENNRVVLYINGKAVSKAGLSIQGRLLRLAKSVSG